MFGRKNDKKKEQELSASLMGKEKKSVSARAGEALKEQAINNIPFVGIFAAANVGARIARPHFSSKQQEETVPPQTQENRSGAVTLGKSSEDD